MRVAIEGFRPTTSRLVLFGGVPVASTGTTGTHNSAPRGTSTPGGMTPTISTALPSSTIRWPTTFAFCYAADRRPGSPRSDRFKEDVCIRRRWPRAGC
jgi:hypothetical protein